MRVCGIFEIVQLSDLTMGPFPHDGKYQATHRKELKYNKSREPFAVFPDYAYESTFRVIKWKQVMN